MPRFLRRVGAIFCGALLCHSAVISVAAAESIAAEIERWERRVQERPGDVIALAALGQAHLRQARQTGDLGAYAPAEVAFQAALAEFPEQPGALAGLASIRSALHRFAEARDLAEKILQRAPDNIEARLLLADAQLALGNVETTATIVNELADSPAVFSRRAELARLRGANAEVLQLCLRAAEAAEARGEAPENVSWYRVRAGEMLFRSGKLQAAEEQYRLAAERAPQSFSVVEHLAELRGAQEEFPEAIKLYEQLIAQSRRPDLEQALGDLYVFMRQPEQAKTWHEKALAGYLASVERGEVHFIHHLAGFYADVREDGAAGREMGAAGSRLAAKRYRA